MSSIISAFVAVHLGVPTPQDATPSFLSALRIQPPTIEEVTKHLEGQKDFQEFLIAYKQDQNNLNIKPLKPHDISIKIEDHASKLNLKIVDSYSQQIIENIKQIALERSNQVLLTLFPWEMYDYFVPKLKWIGSSAISSVRWFKTRYRDALTEGGFLTRLEQDDFSSAGRLAHQKAQYYCQAFLQEKKMQIFATQNQPYSHLGHHISNDMIRFKAEYDKWNRRRLSIYEMSYIVLQARQMQVRLKLSLNLEEDEYKIACRRAHITSYEHWINAIQSAFYNRTMDEKNLSHIEQAVDKTLDVLETIGVSLGLQESSQKPPPFPDCLKKLKGLLREDKNDLKTMWAPLTCDPLSWDMDDWVLKPATEFEKKHATENTEMTAEGFLVQLITLDHASTAELLCHAMTNKPTPPLAWSQQKELVQEYNRILGALFTLQKQTDAFIYNLVGSMTPQKEELNNLPSYLQRSQDLSFDLYNGIVCLKGSLLQSILSNFDQQNKALGRRILEDLTRKSFHFMSDGSFGNGILGFTEMKKEITELLSHAQKLTDRMQEVEKESGWQSLPSLRGAQGTGQLPRQDEKDLAQRSASNFSTANVPDTTEDERF